MGGGVENGEAEEAGPGDGQAVLDQPALVVQLWRRRQEAISSLGACCQACVQAGDEQKQSGKIEYAHAGFLGVTWVDVGGKPVRKAQQTGSER